MADFTKCWPPIDYFLRVILHKNCVSLKLICASLNVNLSIFINKKEIKFGQLIRRKVIEIVANRCQILKLIDYLACNITQIVYH